LKFCTRLFESVLGGQIESGFCPSSTELDGPGSLLLRSAHCHFLQCGKATYCCRGCSKETSTGKCAHNYISQRFCICFLNLKCLPHALQTWQRILSRTSIRPLQTNRISSSRLFRTTGISFSTFGSRSKNCCRLCQMKTPASTMMIRDKRRIRRSE
jgi:hypothetical protein